MASITTTVDTVYTRVGVTLAGFSADGPVEVYRVHPDNSRYLVRGVSDISGGAAFGWDYEAPLAVPVHYEADDAGSTVVSYGEVERTNYAWNPDFETSTLAWSPGGTGTTATFDTTTSWNGVGSLRLNTTNAFGYVAQTTSTRPAVAPGEVWTASIYVKGTGVGSIRMTYRKADGTTDTANYYSASVPLTGDWQRISLTTDAAPAESASLVVWIRNIDPGSMWVDGILIEKTSEVRPYFDGDTPEDNDHVTEWRGSVNSSYADSRPRFVTIPETRAWLRSPGLPILDMTVDVAAVPSTERTRPTVVLRPFGRRSAIVLSDSSKSPEFTIRLRTYTYDEADALVALFEQTPVGLLLMPGAREAYRYVSLGRLVEVPVTGFIARDPRDEYDPGAMAEWDVECVVTDSPVGGIYGDPTASYQAVLDATPTYGDLLTSNPAYLDVLKGV